MTRSLPHLRIRPFQLLLPALAVLAAHAAPAAQRAKPEVPDLTAGGVPDEHHDWNLGPTGARGWMWGWKHATSDARQVLVTQVASGSPADGVLRVGDVLLGVGETPFDDDPRRLLGEAVTRAETEQAGGRLVLLRWREGEVRPVTLQLEVLGTYSPSSPFDCPKAAAILDRACAHLAAHLTPDIPGMVDALALLASGREEHLPAVRALAHEIGDPTVQLHLEGRTSGLLSWRWGYRNLFLCEYFLATGDREVMPAILEHSRALAEGQSGVGTWGHGMAWPDLNGGRLHGRLGGYGALNQAGLVNHLSLVLARRCGVRDPEVDAAVQRANRFAAFYAGKGAIPYGDHRPGWDRHDDNGKDSLATLIFDLQGLDEPARFFGRMTVASHAERELGHTGNYFSYLWGPVGAARLGPAALAAFLAEQRAYLDLARAHDGSFPYQGGAAMSGGEHQYADWDCTGAFVLACTVPDGRLVLSGRGTRPELRLEGDALRETVDAGRGFHPWDGGAAAYDARGTDELLRDLESWSPAVRTRAAEALARRDDVPLEVLRGRLTDGPLESRLGACQALGALGARAADAVPDLVALLEDRELWLRIQAAYALASVGDPARVAAPDLLRLALRDDPADPRRFTQRYLAFCLFYPGGALGMRGLLARSVDGIDRDLLRAAVERLLTNDDGRARAAVGSVYRHLTLEELKPLLPAVVESIRTPSPSGVMFASGIRLQGLELLARHRIAEGLDLCLDVTEIDQWGMQDRLRGCLKALVLYGAEARPVLPRLHELERALAARPNPKAQAEALERVREAIGVIESAAPGEPLRSLSSLGVEAPADR